jgi:ferredoxin
MAYMIGDGCLKCGACEAACENKAISDKNGSYAVNAAKCTECVGVAKSPKCAEVCPVGVPVSDPDVRESREQLLAKWEKLHPGEKPKS